MGDKLERFDDGLRNILFKVPSPSRARLVNAFLNNGILTEAQVRAMTTRDLAKVKHLGGVSVTWLMNALSDQPTPTPETAPVLPHVDRTLILQMAATIAGGLYADPNSQYDREETAGIALGLAFEIVRQYDEGES